ncbi:hypothetical protein ACFL4T_01335 [candidate division KSB1 bacterium]
MKKITFIFCLVILVFFMPKMPLSQETGKLNFSGLAYTAYYYDLSKGSQDANGFDLTRLYITGKKSLSDEINIRFTTDLGRVSNDQERAYYRLYMKYAYIELKPSVNLKVLVGLHFVPFLAFEEHIWKYRSISKMLLDLEHKQTSSDLGIKIHGQLPGEHGDFAFSLVNGEGYAQPEAGKHKGLYGRITVKPSPAKVPGLRLTLATSKIQKQANISTTITTGLLSYEAKKLTFGAEISNGSDKTGNLKTKYSGTSFFGFYRIDPKWTLIGRLDNFDPEKFTGIDKHSRIIVGIGYWINKDVEIIFDYQGVNYKEQSGSNDSNILYTHLHFNF